MNLNRLIGLLASVDLLLAMVFDSLSTRSVGAGVGTILEGKSLLGQFFGGILEPEDIIGHLWLVTLGCIISLIIGVAASLPKQFRHKYNIPHKLPVLSYWIATVLTAIAALHVVYLAWFSDLSDILDMESGLVLLIIAPVGFFFAAVGVKLDKGDEKKQKADNSSEESTPAQ